MTKQQFIEIGTIYGDDEPMHIDLLKLIATRLLIFAASGGGKSWLIRRILEQSFKMIHQIVLDIDGDFYTLREKFAYILASNNEELKPELPLNAKKGAEMCRMIMETKMSILIDLSSLPDDETRIEFVRDFATEMLNLPKRFWHPVLCVIDEVHRFCDDNEEIASTQALKNLATNSRKRGICPIYATQALAQVNKRAVAQCLNKIIGVAGLDIDIARAANNLGFSPKRKSEIEDCEPGEFFVRGPAMNRKVQKVVVGPVETTHPDATKEQDIKPPSPPTDEAMARAVKIMSAGLKKEKKEEDESNKHPYFSSDVEAKFKKFREESEAIIIRLHDEVKELRQILDDKNKAMEQLSDNMAKQNSELFELRQLRDVLKRVIFPDMEKVISEHNAMVGEGSDAVKELYIDSDQAEITVIEKQVTKPDIDESTIEGKIAILAAKGFFEQGKSTKEIFDELSKHYDLGYEYDNFRKNVCYKAMNFWANRPYGYVKKDGQVYVITELGKKYLHLKTQEISAQ